MWINFWWASYGQPAGPSIKFKRTVIEIVIPGSTMDDPATPDDDTQLNQLGTGWFYWWSETILQYVNLLCT